jgi:hypothetical protein
MREGVLGQLSKRSLAPFVAQEVPPPAEVLDTDRTGPSLRLILSNSSWGTALRIRTPYSQHFSFTGPYPDRNVDADDGGRGARDDPLARGPRPQQAQAQLVIHQKHQRRHLSGARTLVTSDLWS